MKINQTAQKHERQRRRRKQGFAHKQRIAMNDAEMIVLGRIIEARLAKPQWQKIIAGFIVDLAWPEVNLIVEVDGDYHDKPEQREADARRQSALEARGWIVQRVTDADVWRDPCAVVSQIKAWLVEARDHLEQRHEPVWHRHIRHPAKRLRHGVGK